MIEYILAAVALAAAVYFIRWHRAKSKSSTPGSGNPPPPKPDLPRDQP